MTEYENVAIDRQENGVTTVTLHSDGDSLKWSRNAHRDLGHAFGDVADDAGVKVVVLTGTGADFCAEYDTGTWGTEPIPWHVIWWEGRRLIDRLLDIDVPVIGVLNGPVTVHSELVFLSDIVLASDTATAADSVHFLNGVVPGDGVHLIWPHLLGPLRGKYFLLTGQTLGANELLALGAVNEVLPASQVSDRAQEIASVFAQKPLSTLRFTRAILADPLRRLHQEGLSYGLAAEGGTSPME